MKLSDILNEAIDKDRISEKMSYSMATSVGNIAYHTAGNNRIKVRRKRREDDEEDRVIAVIERQKNNGWLFTITSEWNQQELPHVGHLINKKIHKRGMKTIDSNIESVLGELGIRYNRIEKET